MRLLVKRNMSNSSSYSYESCLHQACTVTVHSENRATITEQNEVCEFLVNAFKNIGKQSNKGY